MEEMLSWSSCLEDWGVKPSNFLCLNQCPYIMAESSCDIVCVVVFVALPISSSWHRKRTCEKCYPASDGKMFVQMGMVRACNC
jgi:hypothetical protein